MGEEISNSNKKIVFVTSRFPWPLNGGFEIKNYHLLKFLSEFYDVDAHFIQYSKPSREALNSIEPFCKKIQIYKPNFFDLIIGFIKAVINRTPLQCALYESNAARMSITRSMADANLAVCSVIRTAQFLTDSKIPIYFDLADSLGQVYKHNKDQATGIYKFIYQLEYPRLLKFEELLVRRAKGVFFFNEDEAKSYSGDNVYVLPHGVQPSLLSRSFGGDKDLNTLTFIGKMNVIHNVEMVKWFVKNVMPLIPDQIKLHVIGSNPSKELIELSLNFPRLIIMGYVKDPYPLIYSSLACICPLQLGGGIQNKIIEGLAIGALVISSSRAAQPFEEIKGDGMIVCDSPSDWSNTIMNIYHEKSECYDEVRRIGRAYAVNHFSWQAYGTKVLDIISR